MLYIGIPAYNEATTIGVLLWRLRSVLSEVSREYEVVVYDDASTDETAGTLAPYSRVLPLTVLRGAQRIGYAGAVDVLARHVARTTRYPRRDALLLLQGDFTDPPALVPEFLRRFEGGADLIIGERTTAGDAPSAVRRLWLASRWVLRPFVGITDVRDLTASYRLVRIAVLRDLIKAAGDAPVAAGEGWSANADFLLRAAPYARRVETIPVTPTFGVRTRESRRTAWPDALALAKWGWGRRGQRVAVKVIARTVEAAPEVEESAAADAPERGVPSERRERPERAERRPRREVTERSERSERSERVEREKSPRPASSPRSESAGTAERGGEAPSAEQRVLTERTPRAERPTSVAPETITGGEDSSDTVTPDSGRKPRKRRKRGARRERVEGSGGTETHEDLALGANNGEEWQDASEGAEGAVGEAGEPGEEGAARARRKRSRRGRRRKGEARAEGEQTSDAHADHGAGEEARNEATGTEQRDSADNDGVDEPGSGTAGASKRRRSRRGRRGGSRRRGDGESGGEEGESGGGASSTPPAAAD